MRLSPRQLAGLKALKAAHRRAAQARKARSDLMKQVAQPPTGPRYPIKKIDFR